MDATWMLIELVAVRRIFSMWNLESEYTYKSQSFFISLKFQTFLPSASIVLNSPDQQKNLQQKHRTTNATKEQHGTVLITGSKV